MLTTWTWRPPIWAAMLPQKFSAATTRITAPPPGGGRAKAEPPDRLQAARASRHRHQGGRRPRPPGSGRRTGPEAAGVGHGLGSRRRRHPPYLGMILITTTVIGRPDQARSGQPGSSGPGGHHVLGPGPVALAGHLEDGRQALEGRVAEQGGQAVGADGAVADVLVAVPVGAEVDLGVVEVQASQPVEPHRRRRSGRSGRRPPPPCRTGCPRPTGAGCRGRRPSRSSPPAASITWASSSNDRPTVSPAPAAFSSRIGQPVRRRRRPRRARPTSASATAGRAVSNPLPRWLPMWRTRPVGPHPVGGGQVGGQAGPRLGGQLRVGRGQVDQVGGVAEGRGHRRVLGLGGPVAGQHLVAVLRGLPHPGALGEDLHGVGADVRPVLRGPGPGPCPARTCAPISMAAPYQRARHRPARVHDASCPGRPRRRTLTGPAVGAGPSAEPPRRNP